MIAKGGRAGAGEFDLIERFFAPLAESAAGALSLKDDAALLDMGNGLVVTTDMMIEGVHFLPGSDPAEVAQKLLRVNLSDLAAMGAVPAYYTLALGLPTSLDDAGRVDWVASFAAGLAADQATFGVVLVGGDTVATPGPITLSLTALGRAPKAGVVKRSGAGAGDHVYVSGTIGDAVLGLKSLSGEYPDLSAADRNALVARHRVPAPRCALGAALAGVATAMTDISDGLLQDLSHISETSGVDLVVEAGKVPLSKAGAAVLAHNPDVLAAVLTGGDDYELAFTVPEGRASEVEGLARQAQTPVRCIGRVAAAAINPGVRVLAADGTDITPERLGFSHF